MCAAMVHRDNDPVCKMFRIDCGCIKAPCASCWFDKVQYTLQKYTVNQVSRSERSDRPGSGMETWMLHSGGSKGMWLVACAPCH